MTETISSTGTPIQNLRLTARALLLGDRLEVAGLERSDVLSTAPLAFRAGQEGFVALFRYGVAVLVGLTP
ncbi:MAG: RMD1 family protein, partial [Microvirga sp.]